MNFHTRTFYPNSSVKGGSYETTGGIVSSGIGFDDS